MINLKPIYQRIQKRYNKRGLDISFKEIKILVDNFYYQAKQNYSKLSVPKFCSQNAYISLWLNREIGKDIAPKSVKPINLKNPPKDFKAIAEFYKNYPPLSLEQKINQKQTNDINDKKQKWLAVIKERNQFSIDKGYESRLDMYFDDFNIPKSEYEKFLKTVDKVIIFCKNQIYSNWKPQTNQNLDNYCLVCNSNFFPFKNLDEFLVFFKKRINSIKKIKIK